MTTSPFGMRLKLQSESVFRVSGISKESEDREDEVFPTETLTFDTTIKERVLRRLSVSDSRFDGPLQRALDRSGEQTDDASSDGKFIDGVEDRSLRSKVEKFLLDRVKIGGKKKKKKKGKKSTKDETDEDAAERRVSRTFQLAQFYFEEKMYKKAFHYFNLIKDESDQALFQIGVMKYDGLGVGRDPAGGVDIMTFLASIDCSGDASAKAIKPAKRADGAAHAADDPIAGVAAWATGADDAATSEEDAIIWGIVDIAVDSCKGGAIMDKPEAITDVANANVNANAYAKAKKSARQKTAASQNWISPKRKGMSREKRSAHLIPAARFNLGNAYFRGYGVVWQSDSEAERWWLLASANGDPKGSVKAQSMLGFFYARKETLDLKRSFFWHSEACGNGSLESQGAIGVMYFLGLGVPKDIRSALESLKEASERGDIYAMGNLVAFYYERQMYCKASDLGYKVSQLDFPTRLAQRFGCLPAYVRKGIAMGCFYYGRCLQLGRGVRKDEEEAQVLYSRCCRFSLFVATALTQKIIDEEI